MAPKQPLLPTSTSSRLPFFLSQDAPSLLDKFNAIESYEQTLRSQPNALISHPIAHKRNRHSDVHPWSQHRIHLSNLEYDYINASPIDLGRSQEKFIATQGPVEADHFWNMVLQEGSSVVIMLTQLYEGGVEKCMIYYPENNGDIKVISDEISVELIEKSLECRTEIRQLRVARYGKEREREERTVWHFLFLAWPDYDVPKTEDDQTALLQLIKMSRFRMEEGVADKDVDSKPRIVHCSAGVGRTGTFISLDHLLQELKDGKLDGLRQDAGDGQAVEVDPVFETTKRLREQRMMMVGQPGQYAFIYQVLRNGWQKRYGASLGSDH